MFVMESPAFVVIFISPIMVFIMHIPVFITFAFTFQDCGSGMCRSHYDVTCVPICVLLFSAHKSIVGNLVRDCSHLAYIGFCTISLLLCVVIMLYYFWKFCMVQRVCLIDLSYSVALESNT